jgi:hypothetical protein
LIHSILDTSICLKTTFEASPNKKPPKKPEKTNQAPFKPLKTQSFPEYLP